MLGALAIDLVAVAVVTAVTFLLYIQWNYAYWKRRGLPYLEPKIPFGNLENPAKQVRTLGVQIKDLYNDAKKKGYKHCGVYFNSQPVYMVNDLEYIKNVMAKDFQHFVDRGLYHNEKSDPISAHLFAIGGTKWRRLRTKLTPTFTSGKMKTMFPVLTQSVEIMLRKLNETPNPVDIKDILGRFTTDIIGSCAFGLDCNTMEEGDSPFRVYGMKMFTVGKLRAIKDSFTNNYPNVAKAFGMRRIPRDISDFFTKIVKDTVAYRKANGVTRKDFLQLLIDMNGSDSQLTIEEVVAQSFVFFLAGFETSSTTMTFALYELAKNQMCQDKLRTEIQSVLAKHGGKITYDSIQDMKYLNQVIEESLRLHPPVPFVTRTCVKEYQVPDSDVVIEKGTRVAIPIYGVHLDPDYYQEPEKFDPDRFSDGNKHSRHQYSYMPFGEGPRICIGMRFGMMQTKVGMVSLIKNFKLKVNRKTSEPLKMAVNSFVLSTDGGMWLDLQKL